MNLMPGCEFETSLGLEGGVEALTFHSKPPVAIPEAAPVPARPTKWLLPMLLAKREAPIWKQAGERETR